VVARDRQTAARVGWPDRRTARVVVPACGPKAAEATPAGNAPCIGEPPDIRDARSVMRDALVAGCRAIAAGPIPQSGTLCRWRGSATEHEAGVLGVREDLVSSDPAPDHVRLAGDHLAPISKRCSTVRRESDLPHVVGPLDALDA